jgi:photosystem II stability/assembly factor-like uncharacterized protein
MKLRRLAHNCWGLLLVSALMTSSIGCHGGEHEWPPLSEQKIYVADKFFDIAVLDEKRAIVIGYGGKMIATDNAGFAWEQIDVGTHKSLYSIDFAEGGQVGWVVGEEGLILRTTDGGKTWSQQETPLWLDKECADEEERQYRSEDEPCLYAYLFAVSVVDENTAHIVGDKSIYTKTTDGGKTWETQTITLDTGDIAADLLLAFEDPVLYDVEFLDADNGYIVGEFGKVYHTSDGGESFVEQQESVMDESVLDILDLPTMFDVEFADANNGMIAGLDGRIAVTNDGGKDWNFVPSNVPEFIDPFYAGVILPNGKRWVVGASGQVVTADAGGEFRKGDLGSRVTTWMRRIRFHDSDHGWLVGGFGLIMYTDDGGETWYRRLG